MPTGRSRSCASRSVVALVLVMLAASLVVVGTPAGASTSFGAITPIPLRPTDIDDLGRITGGDSVYDPATGTVTPIGSLGYQSSANAITESGLVVGSSRSSETSPDHAIAYDLTTGVLTDLGTVGFNAFATDVNDDGLVVGTGIGDPGISQGFIHDLDTGSKTILAPGSEARAVNADGLVLAHDPAGHFVLDTATGVRTDLGDRIAGELDPTALSDTGLVAGTVGDCDPIFLPDCGVTRWDVFVHDLASGETWRLANASDGVFGEYPQVRDVTDGGVVVGTALSLDWRAGFVAVPESGQADAIPPPPGFVAATGEALNNRGDLAAVSCYWEDITPAQHCTDPFLTTVRLEPTAPLDVGTASCAPPATISWSPPRSDGFSTITGYEVRRNGTIIADLPASITTFTDVGATTGAAYQVLAHNAQGVSPPSASAAWPSPPCVDRVVRGTVTSGGVPQPGVVVRLVDASDGHLVRKAVTGPVGDFWLPSVPAGNYQLRFSDPTWRLLLEWYDDQPTRSTAQVLVVTDATGEIVADADLPLAARIEGIVTDGTAPLEGMRVRVYDATTGALVAKIATGPDGTYAIEGLAAQDVKIRFSDPTGLHQLRWFGGGGDTFETAPSFSLTAGETLVASQDLPAI